MSDFFQARSTSLYDIAPIDRIFYGKEDEDAFFKVLNISKQEVTDILQKTYYYNMQGFTNNDKAIAKDELSITALTVLRYFIITKDKTDMELAMLYLSFSGKMYPSSHYKSFRIVPDNYRHIMEYAINNMSNKYDIVKSGSVVGAIRSLDNTWLESYSNRFKTYTDEDALYLIQQLKSRISSFIINIAKEFYKAFDNRDYITYDSDNVSSDDYHLSDSDSLKLERTIDRTYTKLETTTTDFTLCKRSIGTDSNVGVDELRSIIDSIMTNPENFSLVKELIRNICTFYFTNGKNKDVRSVEFIAFSVSPKPNSKDELYLRDRDIIETLLLQNSDKYKTRSKRVATKISYNKVLLTYFVLFIVEANK